MEVTSARVTRQPFVVDRDSLTFDTGHTIDWANVADDGTYGIASAGKRVIPAGTVMGSLLSTDESISPRVVTTNPAVGILATDAHEDSDSDAISGYGLILGGVLYENLLPEATGGPPRVLAAAVKTELQTAGVGTGFAFKQYTDSSAS